MPRDKLVHYLLNPEHGRGGHKARVFRAIGITRENHDLMRTELRRIAREGTPVDWRYATRPEGAAIWIVRDMLRGPTGEQVVLTQWEVKTVGNAPKLVTCYPDR